MAALVAVAAVKDEAITTAQGAATAKKTKAPGEAIDADTVVSRQRHSRQLQSKLTGNNCSDKEATTATITAATVDRQHLQLQWRL